MRYAFPDYIMAKELKEVRRMLKMTQKEFAELLGCSKPTIERWETSDTPIKGPVVLLISMLKSNPQFIEKNKIPEKKAPLRLCYMYQQDICTIIDVNELEQRIWIKNYSDNLMFRAFGKNEEPTYQDYCDFLDSRCFPDSRDKLKLILEDLDLPFYDPLMIIEKTQGKMAEDDFWIRIER